MNTNDDRQQQAIERLVDGELSSEAERELLASFEQDSSGWKALAVMFLEDRILKGSLTASTHFASLTPVQNTPNADRPKRSRLMAQIVTVAALMLVAFVSGRFSIDTSEQIASNRITEPPENSKLTPERSTIAHQLPSTVEFVRLSLANADQEVSQIEVPLIPWGQLAASYSAPTAPVLEPLIPEDVRKILAKNGQTVEEQMTYVPFEMPDGRTGIIPVSNIELHSHRYPEVQ